MIVCPPPDATCSNTSTVCHPNRAEPVHENATDAAPAVGTVLCASAATSDFRSVVPVWPSPSDVPSVTEIAVDGLPVRLPMPMAPNSMDPLTVVVPLAVCDVPLVSVLLDSLAGIVV